VVCENIHGGTLPLKQSGFTLIELIVTMTILGIMLAIGVPSYQSITTSMRMSGEIDSLMGDLKFARSEAVKRGLNVFACPTASTACSATNTNWSSGWIIHDATTPSTLRISPSLASGDTLTWTPDSGTANPSITPSGYFSTPGKMILNNAAGDVSQRRCIFIAIGTLTKNKGAAC
jgi:type IV fimbrial biogenesis protein FimT